MSPRQPLLGLLWEWSSHSLLWCYNGHDGISNHQPHDCLLSRLFRHRSKKTSKLRVTGLCGGNSPVTGEFPTQMASNVENSSIWWRHHIEFIGKLKSIGSPNYKMSCRLDYMIGYQYNIPSNVCWLTCLIDFWIICDPLFWNLNRNPCKILENPLINLQASCQQYVPCIHWHHQLPISQQSMPTVRMAESAETA